MSGHCCPLPQEDHIKSTDCPTGHQAMAQPPGRVVPAETPPCPPHQTTSDLIHVELGRGWNQSSVFLQGPERLPVLSQAEERGARHLPPASNRHRQVFPDMWGRPLALQVSSPTSPSLPPHTDGFQTFPLITRRPVTQTASFSSGRRGRRPHEVGRNLGRGRVEGGRSAGGREVREAEVRPRRGEAAGAGEGVGAADGAGEGAGRTRRGRGVGTEGEERAGRGRGGGAGPRTHRGPWFGWPRPAQSRPRG